MTQIQNSKPYDLEERTFCDLDIVIWNLFEIWCL
jgi:hypothetical protein